MELVLLLRLYAACYFLLPQEEGSPRLCTAGYNIDYIKKKKRRLALCVVGDLPAHLKRGGFCLSFFAENTNPAAVNGMGGCVLRTSMHKVCGQVAPSRSVVFYALHLHSYLFTPGKDVEYYPWRGQLSAVFFYATYSSYAQKFRRQRS